MDPLTHAITGAAVSYAIIGRNFGKSAASLGALAGITPDIDHFISSEHDPLLYVEFHRFFTHSIAFSFPGAVLPILPWLLRRERRSQFQTLWLGAWPAYLSHCLLDACTTWGTQLYWPFARTRVSWDVIAIVDPIFTIGLAIGLLAALLRPSRAAAVASVAFALAYLAFGAVQHARAATVQRTLAVARGHVVERSEVMPTLGNNIVWRSIYLSGGNIHSDRIRVGWFSRGRVREGSALPLITKNDLRASELTAHGDHRDFNRFAWFSDGWVARSPSDETLIGDMRYSRSTEAFDPVWGIRLGHSKGQPTVEWVSRERDRRLGLGDLWREISGADERFRPIASR